MEVCGKSDNSVHAHTARLQIFYSPDASGKLPASLFLKICKEGSALFGDSEVQFYTSIASSMPDPPMPCCFHSAYDAASSRYHLLLQDLTETHQVNWNKTPELCSALKTVEALARLHAFWWDSPQLEEKVGRYPCSSVMNCYISHHQPGIDPLINYLGDRISAEDRAILSLVWEKHPALLLKRAQENKHFTCNHGDPNPGNILSPNTQNGRTYLIDRQPFYSSLTTWIGASDLAYMMVHWWETGIRCELQEPLLRQYLSQLQESGIVDYSWQMLWDDYRLAAMQSFYVVWDWNIDPAEQKDMEWVWWPQLQKTLAAYKDLNCAELLTKREGLRG